MKVEVELEEVKNNDPHSIRRLERDFQDAAGDRSVIRKFFRRQERIESDKEEGEYSIRTLVKMIEEIPKDGPYMTPENYLKK